MGDGKLSMPYLFIFSISYNIKKCNLLHEKLIHCCNSVIIENGENLLFILKSADFFIFNFQKFDVINLKFKKKKNYYSLVLI